MAPSDPTAHFDPWPLASGRAVSSGGPWGSRDGCVSAGPARFQGRSGRLGPSAPALSVVLSPDHPQPCTRHRSSFIGTQGRDDRHPSEGTIVIPVNVPRSLCPSSALGQRQIGTDDRRKPRRTRGLAASADPSSLRTRSAAPQEKIPEWEEGRRSCLSPPNTPLQKKAKIFSFFNYDKIPFQNG